MIFTLAKKYGTHKETCIMLASCSRTGLLHDFVVGLINTLPTRATVTDWQAYNMCHYYEGVFPRATVTLMCYPNARGRYLFIQNWSEKNKSLTLCEVALTGM